MRTDRSLGGPLFTYATEAKERAHGIRFIAVWVVLLLGSWGLALGIPYAILRLARWWLA